MSAHEPHETPLALPWLRDGLWVLGTLEQRIMAVIWGADEVAFPELCDRLGPGQSAATVMTVLRRLMDKGLLHRSGTRRNYRYRAAVSQAEFHAYVSQQVTARLLSEVGSEAVAHFVGAAASLDPALLDELEAQVKQRKQSDGSRQQS